MIRIDKDANVVQIVGTGAELLAELSRVMHAMYEMVEDDKKPALIEMLHAAVENATTPEEKLREEIAKQGIKKLIRQLLEEAKDGGKDNSDK